VQLSAISCQLEAARVDGMLDDLKGYDSKASSEYFAKQVL